MDPTHPDDMPLVWWNAEQTAEDVISSSSLNFPPATFEFRVTRDVLALTFLGAGLSGRSLGNRGFSDPDLHVVQGYLRDDEAWMDWILTALARAGMNHRIDPMDLHAAHSTWRWLAHSRILACAPGSPRGTLSDSPTCKDSGHRAGLWLARRIVAQRIVHRLC